jgi:hypothetical protein
MNAGTHLLVGGHRADCVAAVGAEEGAGGSESEGRQQLLSATGMAGDCARHEGGEQAAFQRRIDVRDLLRFGDALDAVVVASDLPEEEASILPYGPHQAAILVPPSRAMRAQQPTALCPVQYPKREPLDLQLGAGEPMVASVPADRPGMGTAGYVIGAALMVASFYVGILAGRAWPL